ncbi:hypothetical protein QYE76_018403 [Lolium multiflorum]|uniref:Zinc knuckle CX2CX4HX4C domain-containing protein n=1 Tax=Lolium multiflorum TaxID=4521 RepID=A0AAD8QII2_LOLMU|nr:hypothetical protein QYE76_018403 [Lolium multiflorum]
MLDRLDLKEEDFDDVVIDEKEFKDLRAETKWLAVARLYTSREDFSNTAFYTSMRYAWNPAQEVSFRALNDNLFVIQARCLGDWKKIVEMGPWLFRGYGVIIKEYDGIQDPEKVVLDSIEVWIQIHKVPDLYRKEHLVRLMASKVGVVKKIIMLTAKDFVRVRVNLKVDTPLKRFTSLNIQGQGRVVFQLKYEKIPTFCDVCGLMGHVDEECGSGEHSP